jgi:hypothetical protein
MVFVRQEVANLYPPDMPGCRASSASFTRAQFAYSRLLDLHLPMSHGTHCATGGREHPVLAAFEVLCASPRARLRASLRQHCSAGRPQIERARLWTRAWMHLM